jgi:hypothetical protein
MTIRELLTSRSGLRREEKLGRWNPTTIRKTFLFATCIAALCAVAAAAWGQNGPARGVVLPKVTGPIPVTRDSYPFMSAYHAVEPVDLGKVGYVEKEYFVSGCANVYDYASNGGLKVRTAGAPYTTRILVRYPADPRKFSGNVIVELLNPSTNSMPILCGN